MWWYGRGNSGGSWLPEEKKANMWPGRGNSGGSWPPAFPARWAACFIRFCFVVAQKKIAADQLIYRALIYPANYQSSELIDLAS